MWKTLKNGGAAQPHFDADRNLNSPVNTCKCFKLDFNQEHLELHRAGFFFFFFLMLTNIAWTNYLQTTTQFLESIAY